MTAIAVDGSAIIVMITDLTIDEPHLARNIINRNKNRLKSNN